MPTQDETELTTKRQRWRLIGWLAVVLVVLIVLWLVLRSSDGKPATVPAGGAAAA